MGNLLDLLNSKIKPGLSDHSADFIGEEEDKTRQTVESTFSVLLAGLIEKGKTEKGARDIHKMVSKVDPRILKDVDQLFTRSPQTVNGLVNIGTRDVPDMMSGKHREAINGIATENEVKRNSTTKVIKLTAPFLLAMLNRKSSEDKLDAQGLMGYINGQKSSVEGHLSEDIINSLQLTEFGYDPGALEAEKRRLEEEDERKRREVAEKRKATEQRKKQEKLDKQAKEKELAAEQTTDKASGGLAWWKWLLPLLLIAALGLFGWKGCGGKIAGGAKGIAKTTTGVVSDVAEGTKDMAGGAVDAVKDVTEAAGDVVDKGVNATGNMFGSISDAGKKALEGIQFTAGSAGSQMMEFINGGAKGDGRFRFNNLNFNTGSAAISGETGKEVDNLASILNAYTDMKVRVEGYTDSVGDAAKNQTLSLSRADAVKNRLIAAGIGENRIRTKGFGADNPVGDNETSEGRAQNRRIEVVILKK